MRSLPAADSTTFLSNASHLRSYNSPAASSSPATLHPRRPPTKPLFPLAALVITDEASPFALRSARSSFGGQQCTTGALLAPRGGEGARGVACTPKCAGAGGKYHPPELPTDHEQYLSGHGKSPGRWYGAGAASLGL